MRLLRTVRDLVGRYDAVLCDVWGVLHDGRRALPGVGELLADLRGAGMLVLLVSNVPRPGSTLPASLQRVGLPAGSWDGAVTSGDVIREELARRSPGPVLRIGRDSDVGLWEGLGLRLGELDQARFAAIAGLRSAEETPADYRDLLRQLRARDLELLCANPDLQVMSGGRLLWCAGAVAHEYAALGGRVVQAGKPHAPIYRHALAEVDRLAHRPVPAERVLAIGDGIGTDVLGANRMGLDCVFIASGVNGSSLLADGQLDLPRAQAALQGSGVAATYVMARLA